MYTVYNIRTCTVLLRPAYEKDEIEPKRYVMLD